jgi:hypothetical protein
MPFNSVFAPNNSSFVVYIVEQSLATFAYSAFIKQHLNLWRLPPNKSSPVVYIEEQSLARFAYAGCGMVVLLCFPTNVLSWNNLAACSTFRITPFYNYQHFGPRQCRHVQFRVAVATIGLIRSAHGTLSKHRAEAITGGRISGPMRSAM